MKRGIRQGCPLSPVLFALYIQPIAEALQELMQKKNLYKVGKPNMLFYADDMVLWGTTKEELQQEDAGGNWNHGTTRTPNKHK